MVVVGGLFRVAPEHLRPFSGRKDRHKTQLGNRPLAQSASRMSWTPQTFRKVRFLDIRQHRGPFDSCVPPFYSQVCEPPNLAGQLRHGQGQQRKVQIDRQNSSTATGPDEMMKTETHDTT